VTGTEQIGTEGRDAENRDAAERGALAGGVDLRLRTIECPLCGSERFSELLRGRDVRCGLEGRFVVVGCSACGHQYLNPAPGALEACYPADYAPHVAVVPRNEAEDTDAEAGVRASEVAKVGRPWYLRYLPLKQIPGLRRLYYWLLDDRTQPVPLPEDLSVGDAADGAVRTDRLRAPRARALEVGCATGSYLAALHRRGWAVQGVELCEGPARAAVAAGWTVHQGTLETAGLADETFGLVAAWMVLEHVPRPVDTLAAMHRLLRPGGLLLLGVPNAGCWQRWLFGADWYCLDLPRHLQHFTEARLRAVLASVGFEQIEILHHRTLSGLVGSLGIVLQRWKVLERPGRWLQGYPERPQLALQLFLAPLAIVLSLLGQGEGLTIRARKRVPGAGHFVKE
jgi:SAM-dependent methyltransferase